MSSSCRDPISIATRSPYAGAMTNPLFDDRFMDFLLDDVLDIDALFALEPFKAHDRETVQLFLDGARRVAREELFPRYRAIDRDPPTFEGGRIRVHQEMHHLWRSLVDMGFLSTSRPESVGGAGLPLVVTSAAFAYLMAGNLSALSFVGLTTGAAHLIEAFGSDALKERFMRPMYEGRYAGTMALTEPQAGSGLADITTRATPCDDGSYAVKGAKIFISGGDHDLTENIVHLVLARIDGAPAGTKGISLFAVPARMPTAHGLVDNDVTVTGNLHKIGWRGVPSLALDFGGEGRCRGFLVGSEGGGLGYMFQLMNEARMMVGLHATATSSVAYHEAREYAIVRKQGRPLTERDPRRPMVPIIEHADVRRMLLRQKAIVDGGLALTLTATLLADQAEALPDDLARERARLLLDTLTPVVKTWPAEKGFESCALAVQVHGGYGYTSEYLPEAFLRDQKLNTIHEGTTGIQSLDLLGRKVVAGGGQAMQVLTETIHADLALAAERGAEQAVLDVVAREIDALAALTLTLATRGLAGDVEGMMRHSASYLDLFATVVVSWQHARLLGAAEKRARARGADDLVEGTRRAARYFIATELSRAEGLRALIASGEESYATMQPEWF
jgi:alkylation response protein AidB-like acyl-CoA dehydrogenase